MNEILSEGERRSIEVELKNLSSRFETFYLEEINKCKGLINSQAQEIDILKRNLIKLQDEFMSTTKDWERFLLRAQKQIKPYRKLLKDTKKFFSTVTPDTLKGIKKIIQACNAYKENEY